MAKALEIASYLLTHCKAGRGAWTVKLGTRGLDSLRVNGQPMRLEIPHAGDETDGERVFLRAADGDCCDC